MATKTCTKCKIEKNVFDFHKNKAMKDGLHNWCKGCKKQYNKDNALRISNWHKQHYKDNIPQITKQHKQYYNNNASRIIKQQKQHDKENALFETYFKRLEVFEEVRRYPKNLELLEVKCAYCGKWMLPTSLEIKRRITAINMTFKGEQHFYCSDSCKSTCPIFNQNKYPKGFKKATSREVVPLLRQLVLKRDDYTCQKCGATIETAQLHVHHEKSYTLNKIMANDPDNCITLCKECHKSAHAQKGCRNIDLQCKGGVK